MGDKKKRKNRSGGSAHLPFFFLIFLIFAFYAFYAFPPFPAFCIRNRTFCGDREKESKRRKREKSEIEGGIDKSVFFRGHIKSN